MHVEPCYELNCVPPKRYVEANPGPHECELLFCFLNILFWLCHVLVVAHGIFNLRCTMQVL